jgi:hypothetical protein
LVVAPPPPFQFEVDTAVAAYDARDEWMLSFRGGPVSDPGSAGLLDREGAKRHCSALIFIDDESSAGVSQFAHQKKSTSSLPVSNQCHSDAEAIVFLKLMGTLLAVMACLK